MSLPRLHIITDDAILARPEFLDAAAALLDSGGAGVALHIRGHHTPAATLLGHLKALIGIADRAHATVFVNDRIDVAIAGGAHGLQLGERSIAVRDAKHLWPDRTIGRSVHSAMETAAAAAEGADFVILGSIWDTATHPGRTGSGTALIRSAARRAACAIVAIGGVTPARVSAVLEAGGDGIAVLSGIWASADPVGAIDAYLGALARCMPA